MYVVAVVAATRGDLGPPAAPVTGPAASVARLMLVADLPPMVEAESVEMARSPAAVAWALPWGGCAASDCVRKGCLSASLGEMRCAGLFWGEGG